MDELTKFANEIILDPMAHLNTYQARVAFAKSYLTLQKRVEELERKLGYLEPMSKYWEKDEAKKQLEIDQLRTSISEAVKEIEAEWLNGVAGTDGNRDDVYQSGAGKALDILRKHGLIGCNK